MAVTKINKDDFNKMVHASVASLENNEEMINSLNVFPVPDGDTGTNIYLSFESGVKYVDQGEGEKVGDAASALAKGLLMGARGNSGVILSQIFRGFAKSVENKNTLNAKDLVEALMEGTKTAYQSVMKPTEGTILTVIRLAAQAGRKSISNTKDIGLLMDIIVKASQEALATTPDLLPVLKEVGVVDSGGKGLVFILSAFADVLNGREIKLNNNKTNLSTKHKKDDMQYKNKKNSTVSQSMLNPDDIVYRYCTQIMVRLGDGNNNTRNFNYQSFYSYLSKLGDSLLVINDDEVVKVHVHTNDPGVVLNWGQKFGDLINVKIDNMHFQQEEILKKDFNNKKDEKHNKSESQKETAIISVVSGEGLERLFKSLGVTNVINGGQTFNPSTETIVKAVNNSNAKKVILLPNNKNIFLAAEQAKDIVKVPLEIIHTKTVLQGLTSMLGYDSEEDLKENKLAMEATLDGVKSGQITIAVRDSKINDLNIKKGNYIGIIDGTIQVVGKKLLLTAMDMLKKMLNKDSEIVNIIYGKDENKETADKLKKRILSLDSDLEVEVHEGDQPVYNFLISVE